MDIFWPFSFTKTTNVNQISISKKVFKMLVLFGISKLCSSFIIRLLSICTFLTSALQPWLPRLKKVLAPPPPSTVLSLNSLLKCWGRPQLRNFSNHRHQHSWVYIQLSKIFCSQVYIYIWVYTQPHFIQGYKRFHECIKYTQWYVYIRDEVCYLINTCCRQILFTSV